MATPEGRAGLTRRLDRRAVEAVAAESIDPGTRLWSERRGEVGGEVVDVEEVDGGDRVRIHFRHAVNDEQSTVSAATVNRDTLIPVVCR